MELLQRQDNLRRGDERSDALRLAAVASGLHSMAEMFPEYFPDAALEIDEDSPEDVLTNPDVEYDYSAVEWESPSDMAEADMQALEEFLANGAHQSVSGADLDLDDEDEGWV